MKTYTAQEKRNHIIGLVRSDKAEEDTDDTGEIVLHTGLYKWDNGDIKDYPDPDLKK